MFTFLKYINPIWFFHLPTLNSETIFPNPESFEEEILNQLEEDINYSTRWATNLDLSWQVVQKGYIGNKTSVFKNQKQVAIEDEYHFIRKYYKSFWASYCLLLRLCSFKNPIKEIKAFYKTRNTTKIDLFSRSLKRSSWNFYESELLKDSPLISIIIPTLNRYKYLKDVLNDLEKQNYTNFDVIIIDQSEPFQKEFYKNFNLDIKVRYQKEKALWLARNTAIKMSTADFFLLFDDDSRVESDWINNHIKGLDFFNADISSGQSISSVDENFPINYQYFRYSDLLDTGNVLIKKNVFKEIGLFDKQFEKQRMGDGEFGMRAYMHGFLNISNPYATRLHLKVALGGLREMGSWDAFRPKKLLAPRPIPSVLYYYRKYYGKKLAILGLLKSIPPSIVPYRFKRNKKILVLGILIALLIFPLLIIQVARSWYLASQKLKQGPLIDAIS